MRQAAKVVLVDGKGRVLLLRRSHTDPWKPGHWNLPGGGVEEGEPVVRTALREVQEETGIRLPPDHLVYLFSYRRPGGLTHILAAPAVPRPSVWFPDREHDAFSWASRVPQRATPGLVFVWSRLPSVIRQLHSSR